MRLGQVAFVLRHVLKSLRELLWTHLLTAAAMAMALFIFGGFLLIEENLQGLLKRWGGQIQLFAYLKDGLSSAELKRLERAVRSYPEVEGVRYVSEQAAWEQFKKGLGSQSGLLEGLEAGVLPASFEIVLKKAHRERASLRALAHKLGGLKGIGEVEYPEEWVDKLGLVVRGVEWAKWILGGLLLAATLMIVGSTVKLAILARRDEIEVMQLVGASERLIKAPFVIEGMIQGLAASAFSLLLLWLLFFVARWRVPSSFAILAAERWQFLDVGGIAFLLLLGWLLGAAGSLLSLRRFLKA